MIYSKVINVTITIVGVLQNFYYRSFTETGMRGLIFLRPPLRVLVLILYFFIYILILLYKDVHVYVLSWFYSY